MKTTVFFLLMLPFFFSCEDGHNNDAFLIEADSIARRACECDDTACAEPSAQALSKLKRPDKLSDSEQTKIKEIEDMVAECLKDMITVGIEKDYEKLSNKVCACKDYDCAETKITALQDLKKTPPSNGEDIRKINKFIKKMHQCQKLLITDDVVRRQMNDGKIIKAFTEVTSKVCACKDSICAKTEADRLEDLRDLPDPSEKAKLKLGKLAKKLTDCIVDLAGK